MVLKALKWSTLKVSLENPMIKRTYIFIVLIPFLVSISHQAHQLAIQDQSLLFLLRISPPFNSFLCYFAAVSFTASVLVFKIFCPEIILANPSYSSFIREGKTDLELIDYFSSSSRLLSRQERNDAMLKLISKALQANEDTRMLLKERLDDNDNYFKEELYRRRITNDRLHDIYFEACNLSNYFHEASRWFCSIMLAVGFLLVGLVFVLNLLFVIKFTVASA